MRTSARSRQKELEFVFVKKGVEPAATLQDLLFECNKVNDAAEKEIFTKTGYNHTLATCVYLMWYSDTAGKV